MQTTDLSSEIVAVVVVTYNSGALLPDLIASLPAGLADLKWQLVVVDNASSDDSVDRARSLAPQAIIVQTGRNAGYAAGINAGVAAAPGHSCVLVLNPDVRLEPGCVPALLTTLKKPGTGIAVPLLTDAHGERIDSLRREPSIVRTLADGVLGARRAGRWGDFGETVSSDATYRSETAADWAEGSTLLISRTCWDRCGPWDETFFLYSEETDFGLRSRDAGFSTRFTPDARARHLEGGSAQSPALWTLLTLNRVRLFRRRHNFPSSTIFWFVLLLRETSRALLGQRPSRAAARALLSPSRLTETPGPDSIRVRAEKRGG